MNSPAPQPPLWTADPAHPSRSGCRKREWQREEEKHEQRPHGSRSGGHLSFTRSNTKRFTPGPGAQSVNIRFASPE